MFVTVNELVGLPGLPGTLQGLRFTLNKRAAGSDMLMRRREGTKAFEYHVDCLPEQAREIVRQRHLSKVLAETESTSVAAPERTSDAVKLRSELEIMRKCPALLERKLGTLTDKQKQIADARMMLVQAVLKLMEFGNMNRKDAVEMIAARSQEGTLSPTMQRAADIANARKGSTRTGVGKSSLQHWLSDYMAAKAPGEKLAIMAPGKVQATQVHTIPWMPDFLRHWRNPNQPSVAMAYEDFEAEWLKLHADNPLMMSQLPSVDAVRRALKKIPKAERERGRVTGAEYKSLLPFVRRD